MNFTKVYIADQQDIELYLFQFHFGTIKRGARGQDWLNVLSGVMPGDENTVA